MALRMTYQILAKKPAIPDAAFLLNFGGGFCFIISWKTSFLRTSDIWIESAAAMLLLSNACHRVFYLNKEQRGNVYRLRDNCLYRKISGDRRWDLDYPHDIF